MSPKKLAKLAKPKKEILKVSVKETVEIEIIAELSAAPSENSEDSDVDDDMDLPAAGSSRAESAEEGMMALNKAGAIDSSPGSLKNFRHHPDIENFYRFVYENDLRYEALSIIDELILQKQIASRVTSEKQRAH
jgi:hypothetical protein